jgi:hypothetical protein
MSAVNPVIELSLYMSPILYLFTVFNVIPLKFLPM